MSQTPGPQQYPGQRRLVRSRTDRNLGGVCGGLASYLGLDPTLVRVLVAVGALFTIPLGPIAYVVAWMVIPEG